MSFEKLKYILPESISKKFPYNVCEWKEVESKLGVVLPSDYKKLINLYGSCTIGGFIMIYSPFTKNENINLLNQQKINKEAYLTLKVNFPEDFPYEVFPSNGGGLLPWGRTENGDTLNWIVDINQRDWVILVDDNSGNYFKYKGSMIEFLYDILSENIICPIFPDDFPNK